MGTPEQLRARQNAAEAEMEAIVAAHEQALLRYACGLLGNPHAAQDAVQHAFIKVCGLGFPIRLAPPAPGGDPDRRQIVFDCLRQLAPGEQEVLLLRLQEGLPYKTISETTGLPSGTVGRLLHDAVRKLGTLVRKAGAL